MLLKPNGLLPFKSHDGLHWSPMSDAPVLTDGAFDSQNLAFWDATRGEYRAYWRTFAGARYEAVLEIGCGTGKNTALLTEIADSVQAIDAGELNRHRDQGVHHGDAE